MQVFYASFYFFIKNLLTKTLNGFIMKNVFGVMAQLVERLVRNEEASGSNPLSSTTEGTAYRRPFFVVEAK